MVHAWGVLYVTLIQTADQLGFYGSSMVNLLFPFFILMNKKLELRSTIFVQCFSCQLCLIYSPSSC